MLASSNMGLLVENANKCAISDVRFPPKNRPPKLSAVLQTPSRALSSPMSNRAKRRQRRQATRSPQPHGPAAFQPVPVRARRDGWTPGRQLAFVNALAALGCVEQACAAVSMSPRSYYDLRSRPGSNSFRRAVDAATDVAVQRLEDGLLSRALHGEVTPVFYKGEQVGERRRHDNRLALNLLRARNPERYGRWRDGVRQVRDNPDGAALLLAEAARRLAQDGRADLMGRPRPAPAPLPTTILASEAADQDQDHDEEGGDYLSQMNAVVAAYDRGEDAYGDELLRQMAGCHGDTRDPSPHDPAFRHDTV